MNGTKRWNNLQWFPQDRFELDFPLALWFAGLWFYLKAFLYLCYVYMLGLEPPPYSLAVKGEIAYFAVAIVPCLLLGLALWNQKIQYRIPAIVFLGIDTPILFLHILRLSEVGFLEAGLTRGLEFGSLTLNVIAFGWMVGYYTSTRTQTSHKTLR